MIDSTRSRVDQDDAATIPTHLNDVRQGGRDIEDMLQRTNVDDGIEFLMVTGIYGFIEIDQEIGVLSRRDVSCVNTISPQ